MAAPTSPIAGPDTRIKIGSYTLGVEEWTVKASITQADYTNSETTQDTNGVAYTNRMAVVKDVTFSCRFVYDSDAPPSDTIPNFQAGATLTNVEVFNLKNSSQGYTFPEILVISDGLNMRIKDKLMVDVELQPNGAWSYDN